MKAVKQMGIILFLLYLGHIIESGFNIPVPANVIGMVFLFLALLTEVIKLEDVEEVAGFIIQYLAIFYVVPSVGMMLYLNLMIEEFVTIIIPVLISIILGIFAAGKVTELFMKGRVE